MKYAIAACLLITTSQAVYYDNARDYSFSSILSQHGSAWGLLEELVIIQPEEAVSTIIGKKGINLAASSGTGFLAYLASTHLSGHNSQLSKALSLGAGLLTTIGTYYTIKQLLHKQEEYHQLTKMMTLWPQIREHLPLEVQKALESLYTKWETDQASYDEHVESVISFLKAEIHGRYPYKYKNRSEPFFDTRKLNVRLTLDIHKAIKSLFSLGRYVLTLNQK